MCCMYIFLLLIFQLSSALYYFIVLDFYAWFRVFVCVFFHKTSIFCLLFFSATRSFARTNGSSCEAHFARIFSLALLFLITLTKMTTTTTVETAGITAALEHLMLI